MATVEGWDSVKQLNVILALEDEFGIRIGDDELWRLTDYGAIRSYLAGSAGAGPAE